MTNQVLHDEYDWETEIRCHCGAKMTAFGLASGACQTCGSAVVIKAGWSIEATTRALDEMDEAENA